MQNEPQGTQGGNSARGFAVMDEEKQREIARKGGRAAHQKGTAHEFTSEEAAAAGRKGGRARHANRQNRERPGDNMANLGEVEEEMDSNEPPIL